MSADGSQVTFHVYNTLGLNYCPADEWQKLTEEEVNREYGFVASTLNGPRYFVMNSIAATPGTVSDDGGSDDAFTFGGIETQLRATIAGKLQTSDPYVPQTVGRYTTYTYNAGTQIYELTDPDGVKYVMQAYTTMVDKTLTLEDLPTLGDKLKLPEGWSYSSRVLTQEYLLTASGAAQVVNDDLLNAYQLESPPAV